MLMSEPTAGTPADARAAIVAAVQRLAALGLNRGSTGNVSVRAPRAGVDGCWITPSGLGAEGLGVDDLVWIGVDGDIEAGMVGRWQPSSEAPFHRAIYAARADLHAVVHVHPVHATALACLRRPLPAFHYMVAVAGGDDVPCVPYHLFGSEALSQAVAAAFATRCAALLANHGLVAGGSTLAHALQVTLEIESLCETYLEALAAGEPVLLDAAQMAAVAERFRRYGRAARR